MEAAIFSVEIGDEVGQRREEVVRIVGLPTKREEVSPEEYVQMQGML